jgi:hypothetical protein
MKVVGCLTALPMDDTVDPKLATYSGCPVGQVYINIYKHCNINI